MIDETSQQTAFDQAVMAVRGGADANAEAARLHDLLTEDEQLRLLSGDTPFWLGMQDLFVNGYNVRPYVMGAVDRLGIPGVRFVDGPRGCVSGNGTAFPVSMARGATWDADLEERIGVAIGRELRAMGGNFFGGVCINLPRHPAWGRAQETYSENPVLLGELGAALTRGIQRNAIACAKHYALNSMENARFTVDVRASDEVLHEDFLAHFKRVVDEGAMAIMSSYNSVNGEWAGQNHHLLSDILRDQWGFEGFVVSDFIWGMRDSGKSVEAGLDVEAPFSQQRSERLRPAIEAGEASWQTVARNGRRIIATLLRLYATRDDQNPDPTIMAAPEHVELAREAARRSMVLLKNEPVDGTPALPLPTSLARIGVFGRLADATNTGDRGSSDVRPPYVVTALAGIQAAFGDAEVLHSAGTDPAELARLATDCDAAIVIAGYDALDEGEYVEGAVFARDDLVALYPEPANAAEREIRDRSMGAIESGASVVGAGATGGDRRSVRLRPDDVEVIRTVAAACPRTIVCIVTAGAVIMREWLDDVPAVLISWYAGMAGGHALADVLTGAHAPSGRLPYAIARDESDLPELDIDATQISYDRWYGQRLLAKRGTPAEFPLGFGLSYTDFALSDLAVSIGAEDRVEARVTVANTGRVAATQVVQLYATPLDGDRAGERELIGFTTVALAAGESKPVVLDADLTPLRRWDGNGLVLPGGPVLVEAASYFGDPAGVSVRLP